MFLVPVASRRPNRALESLFDDTFERFFGVPSDTSNTARLPALDVVESESGYTVTVELPGAAKEDVKVAIDGRRVDVSAEVKRESEKKEGERVVHRERSVSSWSRSFTLPVEVDQALSAAKLEHGVLTLTLSKKRAPGAAQLAVA